MTCLERQTNDQSIGTGPKRFTFIERLLTGDSKATINQGILDIGICTVENTNKELMEMTKHIFRRYAFYKQKRDTCRHLVKPRSMKLCISISKLQKLNDYLG